MAADCCCQPASFEISIKHLWGKLNFSILWGGSRDSVELQTWHEQSWSCCHFRNEDIWICQKNWCVWLARLFIINLSFYSCRSPVRTEALLFTRVWSTTANDTGLWGPLGEALYFLLLYICVVYSNYTVVDLRFTHCFCCTFGGS